MLAVTLVWAAAERLGPTDLGLGRQGLGRGLAWGAFVGLLGSLPIRLFFAFPLVSREAVAQPEFEGLSRPRLLGLVAGFAEGFPGAVLMRLADVQLSFPFILLALTINAIVGLGLQNIIISLSAAGWVVYARVVRGQVLSVKRREYVQAASALGIGRARMALRHVLPNVAPSIVVVASLQFSQFIVAEAAISFLGFGVQPPTPAWGSMLSEGRDFLYVAWWLAAWPGAALALTALGVNLVGDWVRDVLDPKLRI